LDITDNENKFSIRWSLIKSQFSKLAKSLFHRPEWMNYSKQKHQKTTIWQRRFWEPQIGSQPDYNNYFEYNNPVKPGLITQVKH
jgi:putative transposase